ncbi:MAG: M28 family metallopeptidase [Flammeovirgaceae bacterium]
MKLLKIVQSLEALSNEDRLDCILTYLKEFDVPYQIQDYHTGANVWTESAKKPYIGISSHFDVVPNSPGANDNASAIAVCLEIIRRYKNSEFSNFGLQVYFFDEEETGLKGSKAYVEEYGIDHLLGLINMELVGMGDQFALWPLTNHDYGKILQCFEQVADGRKLKARRFDKIVTNTADHVSFREAGLEDVFTITCISDRDLEVAQHYYKAMEFEVDVSTLKSILRDAPLFEHYHQPTDLAQHLSEASLEMTANTIWETLINLDNRRY